MIGSYWYLDVLYQGSMQTPVSTRWCKESIYIYIYINFIGIGNHQIGTETGSGTYHHHHHIHFKALFSSS